MLVTFDRHPRTVFAPEAVPPLLTTSEEKTALLKATGIDEICFLPFDRELAAMSAHDFMAEILQRKFAATAYGKVAALIFLVSESVIYPLRIVQQTYIRCITLNIVIGPEYELEFLVDYNIGREIVTYYVGMVLELEPSRSGHILLETPQRHIKLYVSGSAGRNV